LEKQTVGAMNMRKTVSITLLIALVPAALIIPSANASTTATGSFNSTITIQANCQVVSTNTLNFGTHGVLAANTDATATFAVQCTNTTAYNVGLDAGTTAGGTVTTRLMTSGSATVSYKMFSDLNHTINWGNTVSSDTVSGTGNGSSQTLTVYGRVPAQSTPAAATYTDTVTVTVTY
jgi:spore coat protein U-like protein